MWVRFPSPAFDGAKVQKWRGLRIGIDSRRLAVTEKHKTKVLVVVIPFLSEKRA
ncbi:MAG TPA: hypothetical protein VMW23_06505 [Sedimentisphaerales bacterium]|nr:hypothetical protein [Sedimentisphaerales bacterium]